MSHSPDGLYKWIGHVVDHFSKYHIMWHQKRKTSEEVVENLRKYVFAYFGLPKLLQSDNGK